MNDKGKLGIFVGLIIIILAAIGVAMGIYMLRPIPVAPVPQPETVVETPVVQTAPAELTDEDREFLRQLDEEIAQAKEQETALASQPAPQAIQQPQPVAETPRPNFGNMFQNQSSENMPEWRRLWSDLKLSPEEEARVRRGFGLIMQRWQSMSPEQRQAETQRLQAMGQRWQTMSDEERNAASQRVRDRFEDWRERGQDELPELSLD